MHAGRVQRVLAAGDAQEAGALLERLGAQPRDAGQGPAGAKRAVRVAVRHDVFRQAAGDARHPPQQWRGRRVDVDADGVDAVLHYCVQRARQRSFG